MLSRSTAKRPRADIDTSGFLIPKGGRKVGRIKPGRYENAKHLADVRGMLCCLWQLGECSGPTAPHHLLIPWVGIRGGSRRSDDRNLVPLCHHHHTGDGGVHRRGDEDAFFREHAGYPEYGRVLAEKLWKDSPYWEPVP
jgi:hypothetical protein